MAWHALALAIVICAPLYYRWGESVRLVRVDWITQAVAMGMVYLGLATVVALVPVRRTLRDLGVLVLVGTALYGVAYVLMRLRPEIGVSRIVVAISTFLGVSLAILPILLQAKRGYGFLVQGILVLSFAGPWNLQVSGRIPLQVELGSRSLSKLPFVIAQDQGLYEKHGLDVELWMPQSEFPGGVAIRSTKPIAPDILIDGHGPMMVRQATEARFPPMVALAGVDCVVRSHLVARPGISTLEELRGKRIGINLQRATTGFIARLLAERMGWDRVLDISIMENGRDLEALREGLVDAIVANERSFAVLGQEGFSVLADTRDWNEPMAGNSVLVQRGWLEEEGNRDAARRFLMALAEAIALFHQQPEVAVRVMEDWHGIPEPAAETIYSRGTWIPRKPYPCYDGIEKYMEFYDSNEMRRYAPEEFYDDSLVRELDESGFLDSLYR